MPPKLFIATRSDVGRVRSRNEDSVVSDPEAGVLVVADGMGGHPGGDVASRLAASEAARRLLDRAAHASSMDGALGERMAEAVRSADALVRQESQDDPDRAGMGTTLTAFLFDGASNRFVIGHVGDSRAYRFRAKGLELLTRDDTWVQAQVEAGRLTAEQARRHPWSSVLSQAVGLEQPAEPAVVEGGVEVGDLYVLCTDGLNAMLSDDEMEVILRNAPADVDAIADSLVAAANDAGGVDNITVGVIAVTPDA